MRARSTRSPRLPSFAVVFLVAGAIFFSLSWWWSFPRGNGVQDPVAKLAMTVAMTTAKQEADLAETKKKVAELRQVVDRKPSSTDELEDDVVPFVFVGGIEGTGHHWYKALFEACGKTYCRPSKVGPLGWQRSAAFFASKMKSEAPARKFAAMALEKDLASAGPDLALYALNTLGGLNDAAMADIETAVGRDAVAWTQGEGMMSYPNWPAWPNKALQMPNVLAISDTLVTSRNAQLRLALTTRDADAIVNSVCLKRNFAKDAGGCVSIFANRANERCLSTTAYSKRLSLL